MKGLLLNKNRNYVILTQIINACVGLIAGKLIAIYIVPEDFGLYNIQFASFTFFSTLFLSPFLQFLKTTNNTLLPKLGSKIYLNTLIPLLVLMYVSVTALLYFYFNILDIVLYFIFLLFIPLTYLNTIISDYLNINNEIMKFSKMSIVRSISGLLFISIFLVLTFSFLTKVQALWSMHLIGFLMGTVMFAKHYTIFKTRFDIKYKTFFKKYIRFAWPLMVLSFWTWINNYFDRYAIEHYMTLDDVGIYNANYGLGSKSFLMLSPMFMILITPQIYAVIKPLKKKEIILKYAKLYVLLGIFVLSLIYFFKDTIGILLLSDLYKTGFYLIFWIAFAFFLLTLAYFFELLFYAESKTNFILYSDLISAVVNIALNIYFIPLLGITGAMIATTIAFSVKLMISLFLFKRI